MKHIVKYYIDNPVDCVDLKVKMKLSGLKYDIDWIRYCSDNVRDNVRNN